VQGFFVFKGRELAHKPFEKQKRREGTSLTGLFLSHTPTQDHRPQGGNPIIIRLASKHLEIKKDRKAIACPGFS